MRQYKVIDRRNWYRNSPAYEIVEDNEKMFVVKQWTGVNAGTPTFKTIVLNPQKFQEERIVDEHEAILLMLKDVKVEEVNDEQQ